MWSVLTVFTLGTKHNTQTNSLFTAFLSLYSGITESSRKGVGNTTKINDKRIQLRLKKTNLYNHLQCKHSIGMSSVRKKSSYNTKLVILIQWVWRSISEPAKKLWKYYIRNLLTSATRSFVVVSENGLIWEPIGNKQHFIIQKFTALICVHYLGKVLLFFLHTSNKRTI